MWSQFCEVLECSKKLEVCSYISYTHYEEILKDWAKRSYKLGKGAKMSFLQSIKNPNVIKKKMNSTSNILPQPKSK
jgi:hypothetical protein